jgi:acetyltransferase
MSTFRLDQVFAARSMVLVGGSNRERSVGRHVLRNIRGAEFKGQLYLVNSRHSKIDGFDAAASIDQLPEPPNLVVVAVAPAAIPDLLAAAGKKGCAAAVIISAGLGHGAGSIAEAAMEAAHR